MERSGVARRGRIQIESHEKAIKKWLSELSISRDSLFALEHTGHYGTCLVKLLSEQGYTFYLLNPLEIKRPIGIKEMKATPKTPIALQSTSLQTGTTSATGGSVEQLI
ncbi:hypothetical protein EGY07_11970 [Chryseobacterium indologenes]|uniref:IS110 family transposase n=1 Tax=Chryseobacterium indologenes TaxID=253 RepID=UPI000F4FD8DD|nr:hypothetical protein EGY07_11970 [Chryseobacterium indologenes]